MLGARGVNVGGAVDARDLDVIRAAGFDLVRYPVEWDREGLEPVAEAVHAALDRDLAVVIDAHHFDEPERRAPELLALWERVAARFADVDGRLAFEPLNEPHAPLAPERWNALLAELVAVVRAVSPERTVIAGPTHWSTLERLDALVLPDDPHLVATIHYYAPLRFTHQGAHWIDGADGWLGTTWGEEADRARVRADLERAAAWARERRVSLFLGEFGALDTADIRDRAEWTALVRAEAERLRIPWCYWDFATDFGAYDRVAGEWRAPLRDALVPARTALREHAPQNAMTDPDEIAAFHDRCSELMRALLDTLAQAPGRPRAFGVIEDAMGWPRRRIASVLGGVSHLRHTEFGGRRPYRFLDDKASASGRWELWMDAAQSRAVREAGRRP